MVPYAGAAALGRIGMFLPVFGNGEDHLGAYASAAVCGSFFAELPIFGSNFIGALWSDYQRLIFCNSAGSACRKYLAGDLDSGKQDAIGW